MTIDHAAFAQNMGLLTGKGTYNYIADILSDDNNCSIKAVRFKGKDKTSTLSRNEYGYKCMLVAIS